ncbi:MAG: GNAT family N-acetyltransferase [Sulfolobaceae archaeon]|nr:GNAT family N-acetyltransferase [Sulfolobaceae archaeon]
MLEEYFRDAQKGYYRYMAIVIKPQEYLDETVNLLSEFENVKGKGLRVAYAFHPWVNGSKERFRYIKEKFNQDSFIDIDYSSSEKYLGETFDALILDSVDDFRPNYVSRLVDTVKGGGLIILYSDKLEENKLYKNTLIRNNIYKSLFEERFLRLAKSHRGIILENGNEIHFKPYSSKETSISPGPKLPKNPKVPIRLHNLCLSPDQNKVLEEATYVLAEKDKKRVLVVTAARGRGKSVSIGLFLSYVTYLRIEEPTNIIITSPTYYSASEIFRFLIEGLKALKVKFSKEESRDGKVMKVRAGEARIRWMAPDIAKDQDGYMIVLDEAAALGLEYLDYILRKWNKVIMISTIQGYEGSGKAFLKYIDKLSETTPLKRLTLDYPIRYAKGDPVEKFIYDSFLLDVETQKINSGNEIIISEITQEELFSNDDLLRKVYAILVNAHYRNSPDDLMFMGDMAFQRIFVAESEKEPIAVAQAIIEGGLNDNEIKRISIGEENEGHLIPHRIIKYMRYYEFGKLKGWRIMRIAVNPELQDRGIGSRLLNSVTREAIKSGVDWIGASFIADYRVLNFWLKNGFTPVYLASIKNEQLNGYSTIVIKPLSEKALNLVKELSALLKDKLLRTLHQVYFNVNPKVLAKLLDSTPEQKYFDIPALYVEKVKAYLDGLIPYNAAADAIHFIVTKYFYERPGSLSIEEESSIIARTLQGKSWSHAALMLGIKNHEVEENLKNGLKKIVSLFSNHQV